MNIPNNETITNIIILGILKYADAAAMNMNAKKVNSVAFPAKVIKNIFRKSNGAVSAMLITTPPVRY